MFEKIFEKLNKYNLHTWPSLLFSLILIIIAAAYIDPFLSKYLEKSYVTKVYTALFAVVIIGWAINRYYIKKFKKKESIKIAICIYADSEKAQAELKQDFIKKFEKEIFLVSDDIIFDVNVVKNHIAEKYGNKKSIYKLHNKLRGNLYIFGEVKLKNSNYYLDLDGLVLHEPIPEQLSNIISKNFSAVMPSAKVFEENSSFINFTVSAEQLTSTVQYIIGVAALVSRDPFTAVKLHEKLFSVGRNHLNKNVFHSLILHLVDGYSSISQYYFNSSDFVKSKFFLEKAGTYKTSTYNFLVATSVVEYYINNNSKKSLQTIKQCKNFNQPQWRYNETFILLDLGEYKSAILNLQKLKNQNYFNEVNVSRSVTDFLQKIPKERYKTEFYFWEAWNFYYKQFNNPLALKSLEEFIAQSSDKNLVLLRNIALPLLDKIKKEMSS